jgi:hypothetical protein
MSVDWLWTLASPSRSRANLHNARFDWVACSVDFRIGIIIAVAAITVALGLGATVMDIRTNAD